MQYFCSINRFKSWPQRRVAVSEGIRSAIVIAQSICQARHWIFWPRIYHLRNISGCTPSAMGSDSNHKNVQSKAELKIIVFSVKSQKLSECVKNTLYKIANFFLSLMKVCQSNQAKFTEKIDPNRSQKHSSGKGWTDWVSTLLMFHQMSSKDQT